MKHIKEFEDLEDLSKDLFDLQTYLVLGFHKMFGEPNAIVATKDLITKLLECGLVVREVEYDPAKIKTPMVNLTKKFDYLHYIEIEGSYELNEVVKLLPYYEEDDYKPNNYKYFSIHRSPEEDVKEFKELIWNTDGLIGHQYDHQKGYLR